MRKHPPASHLKFGGQSVGDWQLIVAQWPSAPQTSPSSQEVAVQAATQTMVGSQRHPD